MNVLIIDNYDSFTYNLYQYVGELLEDAGKLEILDVKRNNKISPARIKKTGYDRIIISPGPGEPSDKKYFGVCAQALLDIGKKIPILGVCLGMQGLAHYYGGKVIKAALPMHGKTSLIKHSAKGVFKNIPQSIEVMRYHSLIVDRRRLPKVLEITARTMDENGGEIMGLRHKKYPICGIQFHPESFATEYGKKLLANFLFN